MSILLASRPLAAVLGNTTLINAIQQAVDEGMDTARNSSSVYHTLSHKGAVVTAEIFNCLAKIMVRNDFEYKPVLNQARLESRDGVFQFPIRIIVTSGKYRGDHFRVNPKGILYCELFAKYNSYFSSQLSLFSLDGEGVADNERFQNICVLIERVKTTIHVYLVFPVKFADWTNTKMEFIDFEKLESVDSSGIKLVEIPEIENEDTIDVMIVDREDGEIVRYVNENVVNDGDASS